MAKQKKQYECQSCGAVSPKWAGQCGDCGEWNTLTESIIVQATATNDRIGNYSGSAPAICNLDEADLTEEIRYTTHIEELDRAMGGGLVTGSVVLIGGDPGIGKSTLLLQVLAEITKDQMKTLYVSGEESARQVAMRGKRLGLDLTDLRLLTETNVERILTTAQKESPKIMVIDSIQTVHTEQLNSAPGNVAQVRESAAKLVRYAKQTGTTILLVGHVTKDGALAGPRVLEHMVDTVLYFEGDSGSRFRLIRAIKNRFGAVNELGVFAMTDTGLKGVNNPSAIFLSRREDEASGSVVMVTREGTRPLMVEVQALVDESKAGNPRRVAVGMDQNRLGMLLAVLHRHAGIATYDQDVFINIVGGVRITETGADLAVILAILSSLRNQPLPTDLIVFGEVGLTGELRPVQNGQERINEAQKHGFKQAIVPKANLPKQKIKGIEIKGAATLDAALSILRD
ncbi:MAG: DNA repair protein RadA [Gammaproteobacteria bacterium]